MTAWEREAQESERRMASEIDRRRAWCVEHGYVGMCACHDAWRGFTAEEWASLRDVGTMGGVEFRDCPCGSTVARYVEEQCPPTVRNDR